MTNKGQNVLEESTNTRSYKPLQAVVARLALVVGGLLMGVLFTEVSLRIIEQYNVKTREKFALQYQMIPDPELGFRIPPNAGGHDAHGFRNVTVPDHADIIAIGDSHTWGQNAPRSQAWPQQVESLSGHSIYNLGIGGYGPVQYWQLTDDAIAFSPTTIVIAIYLGNDIWDAYSMVYTNDLYSDFRNSDIEMTIEEDTISSESQYQWDNMEETTAMYKSRRIPNTVKGAWLLDISILARQLYEAELWFDAYENWAVQNPHQGAVYETDEVRTVLTYGYRSLAIDLDEPQIAEGLSITQDIILRIQEKTQEEEIELLIVFIPTKEAVYANAMEAQYGDLDDVYTQLIVQETKVREELLQLCTEHDINCLDVLPAMQEAVENHEQLYREHPDGHPVANGYRIIAKAINERLEN